VTDDIRPLGSSSDWVRRWVKTYAVAYGNRVLGQGVKLIAINRHTGEIRNMHGYEVGLEKYEAAATREQALEEVLADAIGEADEDLERRRREAPEPEPKPAPMDPATRRFLETD
jgi:hypothetical protein